MTEDSRSLSGKVIVVTGAGQGIGRAYAHSIAADGATLILADVNVAGGNQVVSEIEAAGGSASFFSLDVSNEDSCREFATAVATAHGRVDGLVNNAAIFSTIAMHPFWEISVAEWDRLMGVNLKGPWLVTTALLDSLKASNGASIINISSDAVQLGRPGYLHYVASKAGLAGMTFSMANELGGFGIRVNTVSPGPTYTEVQRDTVSSDQKTAMLAQQNLHREAHPDDIVGAVKFLLSDASGFITGQTLHVNGGLVHA